MPRHRTVRGKQQHLPGGIEPGVGHLEIVIPTIPMWEQVGGDMSPGAYGGILAKADGNSIELLEIQPVREHVGDSEAAEIGFPFWTKEAYFDLNDLDPKSDDVRSALQSIGMELTTLEDDFTPEQRAMVIAEALLGWGRGDEGESGWSKDVVPEQVKWWGGKIAGPEYLADDDESFKDDVLGYLRMTPEAALQLAGELSQQVSGSKPRSIPGGYRFSDKNEAAQFTTYSPEYSQKVVVVVSIFADGSATVGFFGDEGTSETTRYENVGHFTYSSRTDLPEMVKDIQWVWETVDGYAASWQEDEGGEVDETGRTKTASMYQEAKVFINGRFQVGFTFTPQHGPYDAARTVLQHARSGDVIEVKQDNEVWTYDVTRQPGKPATIVERIESRVDPRTWAEDADGQSTTAPREPALKRVGARDVGDGRTYSGSDIARMHDDLRNHWAADFEEEWRTSGSNVPVRRNLPMSSENALKLAGELSQQVSGSKPKPLPGGYRFSDKNEAAQFTTYSPEYSQKVVCVVSVFEDGSTAVGIFSDEGLSGTATYENIAHFTYDGADVSSMVKDIEWVWKTVDGYAASWQEDDGGEVDEHRGAKREPSFKRVGARVKYNYTDGPIPAGTLGTIIGFLPRSYQAQIRWDNETVSNHTPDEYDMIHRGTKAAEARRPTKSTPAWQSRRIDLNFAGYDFTSGPDGTVIHRDALPPRVPGKDYGADPIGDGTFRMVPSGDIVDFDERNRRLKPIRETRGVRQLHESAYKQGTRLTAKKDFQFKAPGARGRQITVKAGQKFWVTNTGLDPAHKNIVMIDREGKGHISHGYAFSPEMIADLFQVEPSQR